MRTWIKREVWKPFLQLLNEVGWFSPFVTGVVIGLAVNIFSGVILETTGIVGAAIFVLMIFAVTFVFANRYMDWKKKNPDFSNLTIRDRPSPPKKRGLIVMVTPAPTHKAAINYHAEQLKHVWFIATPAMLKNVKELEDYCTAKNIRPHRLDLEDEYDASGCYALVRDVFTRYAPRCQLNTNDVVADMTGGTKPMTAAMVLACLDVGGAMLEHVAATNFVGNEPVGPVQPIQIVIEHGNTSKSSNVETVTETNAI